MSDEPRMPPHDLTDRQLEVARLVAEGWTPKQIAVQLQPPVTPRRVLVLITSAVVRLGLEGRDDRLTLALWYRREVQQDHAA